jgi:predicted transcriptional regulator
MKKKETNKTAKTVKLPNDLIERIEAKAELKNRSAHWMMVDALKKAFK